MVHERSIPGVAAQRLGDRRHLLASYSVCLWALGCASSGSMPQSVEPPAGHGTGTGTVEGHPFQSVRASYFIGESDDPVNTTVIYLFDAKVSCTELGAPGWDGRIADGTGALEIKLLGTTAGAYPVSSTPNGTSGESLVNFTVSSTSVTPKEMTSSGGSVTLKSLTADSSAKGLFDLTFPDGTLQGTFAAAWCPGGKEP
jgi:hypothetical protein